MTTTIVRRYQTLHLQHHDRATLLAGKLHAILQRPYPKGRDVNDLLWYLSDPAWPEPNLVMLNNALQQTGWDAPTPFGRGLPRDAACPVTARHRGRRRSALHSTAAQAGR